MLLPLYHLAWTLVAGPLLSYAALSGNDRLHARLVSSRLPDPFPQRTLWIHALSVGEVISALPLVHALRQAYPSRGIAFTVTTKQGMEIARRELHADATVLLFMPFDFWWSVHRVVRVLRPSLFLLVETDLWPGLLHHLKRRGIPTLLVNGRVSPHTLRSYMRCPSVARMMFKDLDLCLMQTDLDRERLIRVGVRPQRLKTTGNIKFDRNWVTLSDDERGIWLRQLRLSLDDPVWVAGSTHRGEDSIVLDVFQKLLPLFPRLRLIIAPRRLEEAADVYRLAEAKGLKPLLRTDLPKADDSYGVLVLNTMGELGSVYSVATISFVGGSLVPQGGHNLLEPARMGCPVLFGPNTQDFDLMSELLIEAGGGRRVRDGEELFETMKTLLSDREKKEEMGYRAKAFVEGNRGALTRIMEDIKVYLGK